MPDPTIIAAVVAALGVVGAAVRKITPPLRRLGHLIDDITGEPPRDGLPEGRPGVMARLDALDAAVREVKAEVTANDGTSLKDAVDSLRGAVERTEANVNQLTSKLQLCVGPPGRLTLNLPDVHTTP